MSYLHYLVIYILMIGCLSCLVKCSLCCDCTLRIQISTWKSYFKVLQILIHYSTPCPWIWDHQNFTLLNFEFATRSMYSNEIQGKNRTPFKKRKRNYSHVLTNFSNKKTENPGGGSASAKRIFFTFWRSIRCRKILIEFYGWKTLFVRLR